MKNLFVCLSFCFTVLEGLLNISKDAKLLFPLAVFSPRVRMQSLRGPAMCLWRVTGPWTDQYPSVMDLESLGRSKKTFCHLDVGLGNLHNDYQYCYHYYHYYYQIISTITTITTTNALSTSVVFSSILFYSILGLSVLSRSVITVVIHWCPAHKSSGQSSSQKISIS